MNKEILLQNKPEKELKLPNSTLLFLIKKPQGEITDICLAMKKRGFGVNRLNGVGGKVKENEMIEEALERETMEEIGVRVSIDDLQKVAELSFYFPHNCEWDQLVHVYFSEKWDGQPKESDEMKPGWFSTKDIPFENMWSDDIYWLPEVLKGNLVRATFKFKENDIVADKDIKIVDRL
jgi:8-oxo-dGTP pyrophosphatase MutT (NUDIX family)